MEGSSVPSTSVGKKGFQWKALRNLIVPLNLKLVFGNGVIMSCLPKQNCYYRTQGEAGRIACNGALEIDLHVLFSCPLAPQLRKLAGIDLKWAQTDASSFAEVWIVLVLHLARVLHDFFATVAMIWWQFWNVHNARIFQRHHSWLEGELVIIPTTLLQEFLNRRRNHSNQMFTQSARAGTASASTLKWKPPPHG